MDESLTQSVNIPETLMLTRVQNHYNLHFAVPRSSTSFDFHNLVKAGEVDVYHLMCSIVSAFLTQMSHFAISRKILFKTF